jgi:hypothetical protein
MDEQRRKKNFATKQKEDIRGAKEQCKIIIN